ncbi:MAG: protein arginine kinase [Clostridia bacterium]|nr:protein arginine kinase [Bacillota bacterium]MBO2522021.1 protein arginine kinase [Bacillota bacterium]
MSLKDLINKTLSQWMKGTGPERDIVIGSRVRLARNLAGVPFPSIADDEHKAYVIKETKRALQATNGTLGRMEFIPLAEVPPLERQLLVEKHLISPAHTQNVKHKAVILRDDEAVSIMVNEEDHFRIQALFPGLALEEAWKLCSSVDDAFSEVLDFAYGERFGYLTACPTNVGTGMRASIMMHLPALTMTDQIRKMIGAVSRFGLAVRGIYGEGTEVLGNIYQLSNQITLGHSEEEIIQHLQKVTMQVLEQERAARQRVLAQDRLRLEDRIYRSYGILANARLLATHEAMQLLSDVRLGIDLGIVKGIEPRILQELMVMIRPAHLQKLMGQELDAPARDEKRAALIRERLRLAEKEGG